MHLLTTNQVHVLEYQGHSYNRSDALVGYATMQQILRYAETVTVLVRSRKAQKIDPHWLQVDGDRIKVAALPDPASLPAAMASIPAMLRQIRRAAKACDHYCLKLPDATATWVGLYLWLTGRPYGAEIVADCKQGITLAKGPSTWVRLAAWFLDGLTRLLVKRAAAVVYVSQYLRNRYPNPRPDRQWIICSAQLTDDLIGHPRPAEFFEASPFRIISAGRLSPEKGHLYLIEAFARIRQATRRSVELHIVGDGPQRSALELTCDRLGVADHVRFHGFINHGPQLFSVLDQAHLYILPSLTEGMGRGLIEAMARGLPCLASDVGGVPEYLATEALFEPANPDAMADKVLAVIDNAAHLAAMSRRNVESTQAFRPGNLEAARRAFWQAIGQS